MPVPSSYNDVSEKKCLRDHIGWVWYEREFWTPSRWLEKERNVFIRFGSVNYKAVVVSIELRIWIPFIMLKIDSG